MKKKQFIEKWNHGSNKVQRAGFAKEMSKDLDSLIVTHADKAPEILIDLKRAATDSLPKIKIKTP